MNTPLLNRENTLPADNWYMVAKLGTWPIMVDDKKLVQIVDPEACAAMANRFATDKANDPTLELLVDQDHFSESTEKPSEAFGWIQALEDRADGLWAKIAWTDEGNAAVANRRYRFLSPVWLPTDCQSLGNNKLRPTRLLKAAVTNEPNIKGMVPLKNREQAADTAGKDNMDYKAKLLALLGLAPEATDEQIAAAISERDAAMANCNDDMAKLKNRAESAEAKVATLEKAALEADVEKDLTKYAKRITNREVVRAALMANRADTLKLLDAIPDPVAAPICNRADAKTPGDAALVNREQRSREIETMAREKGITRAQADERLRVSKPELFS